MEGKKVLLVDLDAQANLTMAFGVKSPDDLPYTIADMLDKAIEDKPIDPLEGVIHHEEGVDIKPASIQLSGYDSKIVNEVGRENLLKQYIDTVCQRYEKVSTIFTSNKPFSQWNEVFSDITIASAILDRVLHHSTVINIKGESYRLKERNEFMKQKQHLVNTLFDPEPK